MGLDSIFKNSPVKSCTTKSQLCINADRLAPPVRRRTKLKTKTTLKKTEKIEDLDSSIVDEARKKLKPLIDEAIVGQPANAIGLVLAILNQETGNHKAANILIDEYKLTATFGIRKQKDV